MTRQRILVVDDEPGMLEVCAEILGQLENVDTLVEERGESAAELLHHEDFDLLIADICMPGMSGVELVKIAREQNPAMAVLMFTAYPTVESAVESMKLGAADYIVKPFIPEDLMATARRLLDEKRLRQEHDLLARQVEQTYLFDEMVGTSPEMRQVFDTIQRVAETAADVLITGETGVGKELVARSLHQRSPRRDGRFVPVDCGAIPDNLLESEFFGYEKGAFTGADSQTIGLMEFADGGTFFLDEIGELPQQMQAKLLRALQERRFRRIGGKKEIEVDVRIVTASKRDLATEVAEGRFREDLFYRINVIRVEVPPLRKRLDDIPLLVTHFVDKYAQEMGRPVTRVQSDVVEVLSGHSWPGNVRQLQNVVKRSLVMATQPIITVADLPDQITTEDEAPEAEPEGFLALRTDRVNSFEREYIVDLLQECDGDVAVAAQRAQIPRGTLYRLLKKHDISPEQFRK